MHFIIKILSLFRNRRQGAVTTFLVLDDVLPSLDIRYAVLFSVNSQATTRRSSHTIGQATRTVKPIYFVSTITRTVMPYFRVQLILLPQKNKMVSIKDILCEASVPVLAKFDGANLSTGELNNFTGEMF